ncbi:hypothetical protein E1265_10165 [Streptomyces sp. 8K308]|uniref:hypothetical protein n=1 Tax=Streptomyces sp. 8K308 TaxID=2530388 RepID=UPI001052A1B9|nr:hypothetical protein [Streptomyces sp. 8K308]TDC24277.1 hypothetical protein E1265_10165 [Streptomyces sp. 8K308]
MDVIPPHAEPPSDAVTLITGLEGAVDPDEPVKCLYCGLGIVSDDDHATTCTWHAGKAVAR